MPESLRYVPDKSIVVGWDFSTGGVKCLAFDLTGKTVADVRLPTDLWKGDPPQEGLSELNLLQLEGQARATVRGMAGRLRELGRLNDWIAGGISATHHTAARLDAHGNPLRRAICWNDQTLAAYHKLGLKRLGGQHRVQSLIGGPWAIRYSLTHLVKDEDESYLPPEVWRQTRRILPHGPLAAGYLTGNFNCISVSSAASTGLMDLVHRKWCFGMLKALGSMVHRSLVKKQLPTIIDHHVPLGALSSGLAADAGIHPNHVPLVFPTSDDQQAGLVGGGAVDAGHMAIILGNSAVVNSSSNKRPVAGNLDVMRLNWGPYLWMRCYNNGAQFLDRVVGPDAEWKKLEALATAVSPGGNAAVLPFAYPEPSLKVAAPRIEWYPREPLAPGPRFRAALEALAYLMALGVREHEKAGQKIERISVSGGISRSDLMCRILASVLDRPLERLQSDEGPALGAAVTALAAYESHQRRIKQSATPFTVADAVPVLVRFRGRVEPNKHWVEPYQKGLKQFEARLRGATK